MSRKVLVTGYRGQLGYDVAKRLKELSIDNVAVDIDDFDITDKKMTQQYIMECDPQIIIHCGAYTAVDKAEEDRDRCYQVNVEGTKHLVEICKEKNITFLYISTDYVFDGKGDKPHQEDEEPAPINYYGFTKAEGEKYIILYLKNFFIVRTSWLYGINGNNFVKTMLKLAETRDEIKVVNDQIGAPTYSKDLAVLITDMIQTDKFGIYHGVNEGYCSWYDFAKEIFKMTGKDVVVSPIKTDEYPTKAKRPLNSRLSKENLDKMGFKRLPHWKDALKRYLIELNVYKGE